MATSRSYVFTINNPTIEPEELLETADGLACIRYIVFQSELGDNGTPHYQGYLELTRPQRITYLRANFHPAHYEPRRGTREQARDYAMKEDTRTEGPWESGDWRAGGAGQRTDLTGVVEACKTGSLKHVAQTHPEAILRYSKVPLRFLFCHTLTVIGSHHPLPTQPAEKKCCPGRLSPLWSVRMWQDPVCQRPLPHRHRLLPQGS